jgi:hypothetical protein
MRFSHACWSLPLAIAAVIAHSDDPARPATNRNAVGRGVAHFEPPRSIGTPIDDVARDYTGYGLAPKIAGRLRLDTDASLDRMTRELIRRRLAQKS